MASSNFYLYTWRHLNFSEIAVIKKPNYLTFGMAVSGLDVDEPKLSSVLTLLVEVKGTKM